ncbi:MAG: hypothetical protein GXO78_08210 [Calditrichaeota bacterium]|nr:hypothetical protein [Calditrichota bacterium]
MEISILIVHPESDVLKKLRVVLVQAGYSVITADDLVTAERILEKMKVDFVMYPTERELPDQFHR